MDKGQGALAVRRGEIGIEFPQLTHQEHSLVYDGSGGEGGNIAVVIGLFKLPPHDIELAVKVQAGLYRLRAFHKALPDAGHTGAGLLPQHLRVGGHRAPAQKFHAVFRNNNLQHFHRLGTLERVLGQEKHPHTIVPFFAQVLNPYGFCRPEHQFVGHLDHQAYAIAHFAGGILAGAVLQFFHDLQRPVYGVIGLYPLNTDHCTDTAGVMLKTGVVHGADILLLRFKHPESPHKKDFLRRQ